MAGPTIRTEANGPYVVTGPITILDVDGHDDVVTGEAQRIARWQRTVVPNTDAESLMLRSFEKGIISTRFLSRLIREWQGIEHCATVRDNGYEYQGRPYKSLSAVARSITGTRWNGWVFFGLKNQRGRS